ncbi:MAG: chorismate mutase, partial [Phycisphaerae bacterium]|nr:chorismate mutase [Phycisphaerae bacterium]
MSGPSNDNPSLDDLRKRIDALDANIVELLNQRAAVVVDIGRIKNAAGTPVYAPDREKQVIERIVRLSQG